MLEIVLQSAFETTLQRHKLALEVALLTDNLLGGGRWCRAAQVGHEVADSGIDLMSDGRDHGNAGGGDGTGHYLFVEGPEVFQTAAAAGDDNHLAPWELRQNGLADGVEALNAEGDLGRSAGALDTGPADQDIEVGKAPFENPQDVAQRGSGG